RPPTPTPTRRLQRPRPAAMSQSETPGLQEESLHGERGPGAGLGVGDLRGKGARPTEEGPAEGLPSPGRGDRGADVVPSPRGAWSSEVQPGAGFGAGAATGEQAPRLAVGLVDSGCVGSEVRACGHHETLEASLGPPHSGNRMGVPSGPSPQDLSRVHTCPPVGIARVDLIFQLFHLSTPKTHTAECDSTSSPACTHLDLGCARTGDASPHGCPWRGSPRSLPILEPSTAGAAERPPGQLLAALVNSSSRLPSRSWVELHFGSNGSGSSAPDSVSIYNGDMEKILLDAQRESGRSSSRSSHCDSPPRSQTPQDTNRASEIDTHSLGEKNSSQSEEDYMERRKEVESILKKNSDWIWDWSSRPENVPPTKEFLLFKRPKRAPTLSMRNTSVMKKGGIFSAEFLKVFLPSLLLSHLLAIGLG
ncbi:hypothetical protein EI555_006769, partial [Monodon monoceros]